MMRIAPSDQLITQLLGLHVATWLPTDAVSSHFFIAKVQFCAIPCCRPLHLLVAGSCMLRICIE